MVRYECPCLITNHEFGVRIDLKKKICVEKKVVGVAKLAPHNDCRIGYDQQEDDVTREDHHAVLHVGVPRNGSNQQEEKQQTDYHGVEKKGEREVSSPVAVSQVHLLADQLMLRQHGPHVDVTPRVPTPLSQRVSKFSNLLQQQQLITDRFKLPHFLIAFHIACAFEFAILDQLLEFLVDQSNSQLDIVAKYKEIRRKPINNQTTTVSPNGPNESPWKAKD